MKNILERFHYTAAVAELGLLLLQQFISGVEGNRSERTGVDVELGPFTPLLKGSVDSSGCEVVKETAER